MMALKMCEKKLAANFFSADLKLGERVMTQGEKDFVS